MNVLAILTSITAIITAITALVAVVRGHSVALRIADEQNKNALETAHLQTMGPIREARINQVRGLLAKFASAVSHFSLTCATVGVSREELLEAVGKAEHIEAKLHLMLNPSKETTQRIVLIMSELIALMGEPAREGRAQPEKDAILAKVGASRAKLIIASHEVLQEQWSLLSKPTPK